MGPLHPAEVLNGRFCSAHLQVRQRARAFAECPLLYFQLTSGQKGQWDPTRRERWNPLTRFAPPVIARFARFIQRPQTPHNPD